MERGESFPIPSNGFWALRLHLDSFLMARHGESNDYLLFHFVSRLIKFFSHKKLNTSRSCKDHFQTTDSHWWRGLGKDPALLLTGLKTKSAL